MFDELIKAICIAIYSSDKQTKLSSFRICVSCSEFISVSSTQFISNIRAVCIAIYSADKQTKLGSFSITVSCSESISVS